MSGPGSAAPLVVIGAGPGGYAAAFLAADLGMQVVLIDPASDPGGVCLYRGCIPSKALLHVAKLIGETRQAAAWGVEFGEPRIDLDRLRAWKDGVVTRLTGGLGQLRRRRKIDYIQGTARFRDAHHVEIETVSGERRDLAFAVAFNTLFLEDPRDLVRVSDVRMFLLANTTNQAALGFRRRNGNLFASQQLLQRDFQILSLFYR